MTKHFKCPKCPAKCNKNHGDNEQCFHCDQLCNRNAQHRPRCENCSNEIRAVMKGVGALCLATDGGCGIYICTLPRCRGVFCYDCCMKP